LDSYEEAKKKAEKDLQEKKEEKVIK